MRGTGTGLAGFLDRSVSPGMLFLAAALIFPALLFQQDLGIRALQVALFLFLNGLSGRRPRLLQALVAGIGVIAINLVIPTGRVIMTVIGLPVTDGALRSGVAKATALTGMIAISQFAIRGGLRFPGRAGWLVARSLQYFERIMARGKSIDRHGVMESIDEILLDAYRQEDPELHREARATTSAQGFVFLSLLVAANWAALAVSAMNPGLIWSR